MTSRTVCKAALVVSGVVGISFNLVAVILDNPPHYLVGIGMSAGALVVALRARMDRMAERQPRR